MHVRRVYIMSLNGELARDITHDSTPTRRNLYIYISSLSVF